jgi:hypothetical protein
MMIIATIDSKIKKLLPKFLNIPNAEPVFQTCVICRNGKISMEPKGLMEALTRYFVIWSSTIIAVTIINTCNGFFTLKYL